MEPVIVVHGTFDNAATWWKPEGSFCQSLDLRLKREGCEARCWDSIPAATAIQDFGWSGINSEASRHQAAEMLSAKMTSLLTQQGIKRVHFVAHSHGGNVLLKAFLMCRRKVDYQKFGSFIFLGTPFFSYRSTSPDTAFWRRVVARVEPIQTPEIVRMYGGAYFAIQSRYDEAYHLLKYALTLRAEAGTYARKLDQDSHSGVTPPKSLNFSDIVELRFGRYALFGLRSIARSHSTQGLPYAVSIGRVSVFRFIPQIVAMQLARFVLSAAAPLISTVKRRAQYWGIYFGMKSLMSTALGDDLAFERILSVSKESDIVPTTMLVLSDAIEESMISKTSSGSDEGLARIYRALNANLHDGEFRTVAEAVIDVFKAKQLVHRQYYSDDGVIDLVAKAISGRIKP